MAMAAIHDISPISCFDLGDRATLGFRWKRWLRSFELYADGKGIQNAGQKKALLLHSAGLEVQDIFYTLECPDPTDGQTLYSVAKQVLNDYFEPKINVAFERSQFRGLAQQPNESVEQFVTRLRQKAVYCNFHNVDESIRDQLIEKCSSQRLRRKLLEKDDPTLETCKRIANALEASESQANKLENNVEEVNKVSYKSGARPKMNNNPQHAKKMTCFACGFEGHVKKDSKCPAKGKKCRKCKKEGHFEKCCKSKIDSRKYDKKYRPKHKVRTVEVGSDDDEDDEYVFVVNDNNSGTVQVNVGGIGISVIIDSGASVNVIDRQLWEDLKKNKIKCKSRKDVKTIYAYGNQTPLTVAGLFEADVTFGTRSVRAEFVVVEERGKPLLGKQTSIELGILVINIEEANYVNSENNREKMRVKYPKCFEGLGKLTNYQLTIPIDESVNPVVQPLRRIPYGLRDKLDQELDRLENLDIIEKVEKPSKWVSPIVVVPKKEGVRLCVDMRRANEAVRRERFPIPTTEEVLQDLNKSAVFSKVDILMAYHQIELCDDSREITTFMTHRGMYRYKRLLFGVSCAPEMYNKVITQVLSGLKGVNNIFDDIIVHGETVEQHNERLEAVLSRLQERGLTLNYEKCQFNMTHIEFMGVVLSKHGLETSQSKVEAVLEAREPKNMSEVKSFLGLVNFSARFIPNLATIAEPLRKLTRKEQAFEWGSEQKESFKELKDKLVQAGSLGYFDKSDRTQIVCDASPVGLGCVLVQINKENESRVIMYASRSLTQVERRYSQTEKEALSIVWACERLHMYLIGIDFELLTDHKPLQFIFSPRSKPSARIERWILRLQPYKYTVRYIPGSSNIADPMSRLLPEKIQAEEKDLCNAENYIRFVANESSPVALSTEVIESESIKDTDLIEIQAALKNNKWHEVSNKAYLPIRHELSALGNLVLRGTRIVLPSSLCDQVLQLGHEGHPGIVVMKQRLRSKLWWPGMDKDIESYCKQCYSCQLVGQAEKPEPMKRRELPSQPWEHLSADCLGPLPSGDNILVVIDYYSRWYEVFYLKTITSAKIIQCLKSLFTTHGLPISLQTDNAQNFNSEEFQEYLESVNVEHRNTTPLWPQANGEVERQNRSLMKRIRIAHAENKDWKEEIQNYLMMYRSTPQSTTGVSPAEMLFKRKMRTKLPEMTEFGEVDMEVRDRDSERKGRGKIYADNRRNARPCDIKEGDRVLVKQNQRKNKLSTVFNPKSMLVVERKGNSVVVESDEGVKYSRNVSHVKKLVPSNTEVRQSDKVMYKEQSNQNSESIEKPVLVSDRSVRDQNNNPEYKSVESEIVYDSEEETQTERSQIEQERNSGPREATTIKTPRKSSPRETTTLKTPRPERQRKLPSKYSDFVMSN